MNARIEHSKIARCCGFRRATSLLTLVAVLVASTAVLPGVVAVAAAGQQSLLAREPNNGTTNNNILNNSGIAVRGRKLKSSKKGSKTSKASKSSKKENGSLGPKSDKSSKSISEKSAKSEPSPSSKSEKSAKSSKKSSKSATSDDEPPPLVEKTERTSIQPEAGIDTADGEDPLVASSNPLASDASPDASASASATSKRKPWAASWTGILVIGGAILGVSLLAQLLRAKRSSRRRQPRSAAADAVLASYKPVGHRETELTTVVTLGADDDDEEEDYDYDEYEIDEQVGAGVGAEYGDGPRAQ